MKLFTNSEVSYQSGVGFINSTNGKIYADHVGVTKVCYWGEKSLKQKLTEKHGEENAEKILQSSVSRGKRIHSDLENGDTSILPTKLLNDLGTCLGNEVFVRGKIADLAILGFIDAVYLDEDGGINIVDYKTKSSKGAWNRYKLCSLPKYLMQCAAYASLFSQFYGHPVAKCTVIVLFGNGEKAEKVEVPISKMRCHFFAFKKKASEMSDSLQTLS